jgi:arylsulfatase A-like enzyme/Flp pilus assembly protein TadD
LLRRVPVSNMQRIASLSARMVFAAACGLGFGACARAAPAPPPARNLVLVTIDTLRADHVGAYGYARARTPTLDRLAADGARFEHAYAAAPITLTSHATMLTGRYPPAHGARDNGVAMSSAVPTLGTALHAQGFQTAAFVAAFPLDHQFGLNRGFDVYGDRLPRGADGRLMNERPARLVVDDAIAWLGAVGGATARRFFLWVHLFEPHAPYGDPSSGRSVLDRYDDEIATADREIGRLLAALGSRRSDTAIIVAGDHGEAFGEHGEYAHSIFVYDTTLRVPFVIAPPGIRHTDRSEGLVVSEPVTLADVAPTGAALVGQAMPGVDGIDLTTVLAGGALPHRELYAESFAPLLEFGWAPLRAMRRDGWKYIAAPRPELYHVSDDPGEQSDHIGSQTTVATTLEARLSHYPDAGAAQRFAPTGPDENAKERLRALGYVGRSGSHEVAAGGQRPDPKDRRELAARIAQVTSGELSGAALVTALEQIVRDDPVNGQAHLRLGYARLEQGDCARAVSEFRQAIAAGLPSADAHLGLATCLGRQNDLDGAARELSDARRLEPDNPVIVANLGILEEARGHTAAAIDLLQAAIAADPDLHEARFNLAIAYARWGRKADAAAAARDLLARLPAGAPQRAEVERLLRSVR